MNNRLQRELFKPDREHDPYRDWYAVYRSEVTDRIKHWPNNRKADTESADRFGTDSADESMLTSIEGVLS